MLEPHVLGRTEGAHVERIEPPIEEALVEADGVVELRAARQLDRTLLEDESAWVVASLAMAGERARILDGGTDLLATDVLMDSGAPSLKSSWAVRGASQSPERLW